MTGEQALMRLSEIEPAEFRKLQALADQIYSDSRRAPQALINLWRSGAASEAPKVETVLSAMRELAVGPWLEASESIGGEQLARALAQANRAYLAAVERVRATLDQMMQGKTPMPPPPGAGMTEEKELPSRECDEGYLFARTLLKTDESDLVHMLVRRRFLLMDERRRDTEIANYSKTGKWAALVEHDPEGLEVEP